MVEFKIVLSDPKKGCSYKIDLKDENAQKLLGYKIGDKINGLMIGIDNTFEIEITGGSDKSGFSMKRDLIGPNKRKILAATGLGFKTKINGQRKRKYIRGNEISQDTVQINTKIITYGNKLLNEIFKKE